MYDQCDYHHYCHCYHHYDDDDDYTGPRRLGGANVSQPPVAQAVATPNLPTKNFSTKIILAIFYPPLK